MGMLVSEKTFVCASLAGVQASINVILGKHRHMTETLDESWLYRQRKCHIIYIVKLTLFAASNLVAERLIHTHPLLLTRRMCHHVTTFAWRSHSTHAY